VRVTSNRLAGVVWVVLLRRHMLVCVAMDAGRRHDRAGGDGQRCLDGHGVSGPNATPLRLDRFHGAVQ
jgi:hypothetical protein